MTLREAMIWKARQFEDLSDRSSAPLPARLCREPANHQRGELTSATIGTPEKLIVTSRARVLVFLSLAAALFLLIFPNYIIRPDKPQDAVALQAALLVLRYQHLAEWLCAACALVALVVFLRAKPSSRPRRIAIAAAATTVVFAAVSQINIYELLFHPIGQPAFQAAGETKLDGDEHLLAVNLNGSRAYPIRTLTYHHIVNDFIDNVPIAVTY